MLWLLIGAGLVVRVAVNVETTGSAYDMDSYDRVRRALGSAPLEAYALINSGLLHWPYPPGFMPWAAVSALITDGAQAFRDVIQLPAIAADAALAWVVQLYLGWRAASDRTRVAAAGAVALGPSFAVISGYHGQFDSLAILPAVVAVAVWDRLRLEHRAVVCGLLLGTGGALKTVPALVVLVLLPHVRSWREGATLLGVTALVPAAILLPFLLTTPAEVVQALSYGGVPGMGGLTLAVQPTFAKWWLVHPVEPSAAIRWLSTNRGLVNGAVLAGVTVLLLRTRPDPVRGASLLFLAVWTLGTGFFFQYLIWGFPFMLMAGWIRQVVIAQAILFVPTLIFYLGPWKTDAIILPYAIVMIGAWVVALALMAALVRSCWSSRPVAARA